MKLLRVGKKGNEKPAILDKGGKIRDISSYVSDLNPDHLNFETISKLKNVDLEALPEISNSDRTGPCVSKPGKFVANQPKMSKKLDFLLILVVFCSFSSRFCISNRENFVPTGKFPGRQNMMMFSIKTR